MTDIQFPRPWRWCACSSLLVGCLASPQFVLGQAVQQQRQNRAPARVTEQQIEQARQRGVAWIKADAGQNGKTGGRGALAAMTLLKAGVSADDPEIQRLIQDVLSRITSNTFKPSIEQEAIYEAGVSLMALANADPEKYKPQIAAIANFIIANQNSAGDWDYLGQGQTAGDTSISQYGMLGLWEASRSGVEVPISVWDKAAQWHTTRQSADGGFDYHPGPPNTPGGNITSTHSMSVAGTGSLLIARRFLFGAAAVELEAESQTKKGSAKFGVLESVDDPPKTEGEKAAKVTNDKVVVKPGSIDHTVQRGLGWLNKNFTVSNPTGFAVYYLYGLERLGALADTDKFGGRDWYQEGAAHLLGTQTMNGTWNDQSGDDCATCFAVLFLTKATAKMVDSKRPTRASRFGSGLLSGGRGLPTNLKDIEAQKGQVKSRKNPGDLDKLLAELENVQNDDVDAAQSALIEKIQLDNPEAWIGQKDRLLKLVKDPRAEVRRTAMWALGRTGDMRLAPLLIEGLSDTIPEVTVEARNALKFVSKKLNGFGLPDEPTEPQRADEIKKWKRWYLSVRPYDERDGLEDMD